MTREQITKRGRRLRGSAGNRVAGERQRAAQKQLKEGGLMTPTKEKLMELLETLEQQRFSGSVAIVFEAGAAMQVERFETQKFQAVDYSGPLGPSGERPERR